MKSRHLLIGAMTLTLAGTAAAGSALADTPWQNHHPAREAVNARLHRQDARIHQERREGEMGAMKAARLHRVDRRIRFQERRFAANHHGHISRAEYHRLNGEENHVSRHIGE